MSVDKETNQKGVLTMKVKCNICGQVLNARKKSSMGGYPVQHNRPGTNQPCHGFFDHGENQ